jgi:hypothetical protein
MPGSKYRTRGQVPLQHPEKPIAVSDMLDLHPPIGFQNRECQFGIVAAAIQLDPLFTAYMAFTLGHRLFGKSQMGQFHFSVHMRCPTARCRTPYISIRFARPMIDSVSLVIGAEIAELRNSRYD